MTYPNACYIRISNWLQVRLQLSIARTPGAMDEVEIWLGLSRILFLCSVHFDGNLGCVFAERLFQPISIWLVIPLAYLARPRCILHFHARWQKARVDIPHDSIRVCFTKVGYARFDRSPKNLVEVSAIVGWIESVQFDVLDPVTPQFARFIRYSLRRVGPECSDG